MTASTETGREPGRARVDRWRTKAEVLGEVRRRPGLTRVELARRLGLSSATVTETVTETVTHTGTETITETVTTRVTVTPARRRRR